MSNLLTIAEYNNMGDLNPSAPQEPAHGVQKVKAGAVSAPLGTNTRLFTLWSGYGGEFAAFDDTNWNEGDPLPADICWIPIQPQYEITRMNHMNATPRIAYRDGDNPA